MRARSNRQARRRRQAPWRQSLCVSARRPTAHGLQRCVDGTKRRAEQEGARADDHDVRWRNPPAGQIVDEPRREDDPCPDHALHGNDGGQQPLPHAAQATCPPSLDGRSVLATHRVDCRRGVADPVILYRARASCNHEAGSGGAGGTSACQGQPLGPVLDAESKYSTAALNSAQPARSCVPCS
mgnify:FL=1